MLTASKRTIFYGEEEGPEVLFLLKSGRVKLERVSPAGRKLTLDIVEHGTFFGEMSLLGQSLVGTQAVAIEDAVICAMSRHDLQSLMMRTRRWRCVSSTSSPEGFWMPGTALKRRCSTT